MGIRKCKCKCSLFSFFHNQNILDQKKKALDLTKRVKKRVNSARHLTPPPRVGAPFGTKNENMTDICTAIKVTSYKMLNNEKAAKQT